MKFKTFALYALLLASGFACKKVHDGYNTVVSYQNFSSNEACSAGGVIIKSGLDKNRNNILDSAEVDNSSFLCNGQNGLMDKQIFLSLGFSGNTTSTTPISGGELIKFSKKNYPGVDSIIFVANPYVADITNTSIVELFNVTDNVPINNGKITTSRLYDAQAFLQTGNVYNQLPDKEITLGIRFSSGTSGKFAATGSCFLILYRR